MDTTIVIDATGRMCFVYDDDLQPLVAGGDADVRRVSHVEPDGRGGWRADMSPVGGPVLASCALRADALRAERAWLSEHLGV